jgi:hypothetical protein
VLWQAGSVSGTPELEFTSAVIDAEKGLYWDTKDLANGILRVSDDATLGISRMGMTAADELAPVFTLDGRYAGNNVKALQRGVYIRKGKKIVVK